MFINDLTITIPAYYVTNWGDEINYHTKDGKVGMELKENFNISLTNDNFESLKKACGMKNIDLHYYSRQ